MLVTIKHDAGVEALVALINNRGVSRYVMSVVREDFNFIAVLYIQYFDEYIEFCRRMNRKPCTEREFFGSKADQ